MTPNLTNYMNDMKTYFDKLEKKGEIVSPIIQKQYLFLFKEDFDRVSSFRDHMNRKKLNLPAGKRRMELECLANTLTYMLEKFEVRECPSA
jgi:hypothetical protein